MATPLLFRFGGRMPIICQQQLNPVSRERFSSLSYDVMGDIFRIRRDLGPFFNEVHYKRALQVIRDDVSLEVPVLLSYGSYVKTYYIDVLIADGAIVEFKAVDSLTKAHRAQILNYLMMTQLQQGLLVNVGPERVEKQYVNCAIPYCDRFVFTELVIDWDDGVDGARNFRQLLNSLLDDWGGYLATNVYDDVMISLLGGYDIIRSPISVRFCDSEIGRIDLNLVSDRVAFRITAFYSDISLSSFEDHMRQFILHTNIDAVLWANIGRKVIRYQCLRQKDGGQ